ncbi:formate dehydrogenase major subunit [Candidatus Hakubella thermalkaliphila]|uniref:Formate dehydrogenase major subunit n=1 Tax=Candidatus Hakubella thermalkaliphila TaxID=2754717 RepID=A0A6V8NN55_9ACTN|nr:formate dehydrogenase subunit alpha [Candidatus Hakubella thermalkaliphila]GFP21819.1 formate dehydrogenase major subunit [Candidatus Hakubella thermalkaliphila]
MKEVITVCPYCGAGCQMVLRVEESELVKVVPAKTDDNFLCAKGVRVQEFIQHERRLKKPLVRRNGSLKEVSWEEAIEVVATNLESLKTRYGPDSIGFIGSACVTTEENYVFQKFARAVIGTNNVDHCARLCHAPSVMAMIQAIGSGAMTNTIDGFVDTKVLFIIGYNPSASHPKLYHRKILKAKEKGSKIIVADPRRIPVAKVADIFMCFKPGTEIALLNAMVNVIISKGLENKQFINIRTRTEGYEELKIAVAKYTPQYAEKISGVPANTIVEAATLYATSEGSAILWGMGITQHTSGTNNVFALVNLALLTGNVGRPNAGLNPIRGQNNVQGACDMGMLPLVYPGYQFVNDPEVKAKFERLWGVDYLSDKIGLTSPEIIRQILDGKVKGLYIMGENPAMSQANLNLVTDAFKKVEFMVVQDIFLNETAEYADVVLPACSFAEKEGTTTRGDRRIQRLRTAIPPIGESKPEWEIIKLIASKMGKGHLFHYNNTAEIFDEIGKVADQFAGISHQRIDKEGGIYWPCPSPDHPGTPVLHLEKFPLGRGKFTPVEYTKPAEVPDDEYPLILTTGRELYHYGSRTMTGKVAFLNEKAPEAYIEIHPDDAAKLNIEPGEKVKVTSRRGSVIVTARVTHDIFPGVTFIPIHYREAPANRLTNDALDPVAKIPEMKVCAVKVERSR